MANAIATGPQDGFFEVLDSFNQDLAFYGIEPIDVTNKSPDDLMQETRNLYLQHNL